MIASQGSISQYHEKFSNLVAKVQKLKDSAGKDAKTGQEIATAMAFNIDMDIAIASYDITQVEAMLKKYGIELTGEK